jgi:hypothetical protein
MIRQFVAFCIWPFSDRTFHIGRFEVCPIFFVAAVQMVVFNLLLYLYDSGSNNTIDRLISGFNFLACLVAVGHMIYGRGLASWSPASVALFYLLLGYGTLCGFFLWTWFFGPLESGISQAMFDIIRSASFNSSPLLLLVVFLDMRQEHMTPSRHAGVITEDADQLMTTPRTWGGRERREQDRREETRVMKAELARLREADVE